MSQIPVFWSFRRCPYAMRARLAMLSAKQDAELREILLRDKPQAFLAASAKGTVPVLDCGDHVIAESRDIMVWALKRNDPEKLLAMPDIGYDLLDACDGPFKAALDHTKYAVRFPELRMEDERAKAADYLMALDERLANQTYLTGPRRTLADIGIAPFVRQFANTDRAWFDQQNWPHLIRWLDAFLASRDFAAIMQKLPPWVSGQTPVAFLATMQKGARA